jgi:hypothetical protein
MTCPVCRQHAELNKSGRFALHRIQAKDGWTFCPFSGKPAEWAARA